MDVYALQARMGLNIDDYQRNLKAATSEGNEAAERMKRYLGNATKVIGAGIAATSAVVVKSTKEAVESYAQYEQLVGGVETLFKDAADDVQKNAEEAFRTAGLSANAYMETVTSFSASLLQGLGGDTKKAADVADLAIRDMSDNANKMGTSMQSIQNAYQGFSKQNFMMLDNLKLGYGGTKAEMERLLKDAEELKRKNGEVVEYSIDNYADMIEAIHVIQTEMGITGTTAKEAATTIEGSANAAKAAWQNLLTGFGRDDADIDKLVDEVVDSVTQLGKNVLPVAERAFTSLSKTAIREGTKLAKQLPDMIEDAAVEVRKTISEEFGVSTDSIIKTETAIKAAAAAFVAYKAAVVATDVVQGIVTLTEVIQGATAAQEALNAAGMANPYILLATALATVTVAVKSYIDAQAEMIDVAEDTYNNLTDAQNKFIDSSNELASSINSDVKAARDNINSIDAEVGSLQNMTNELYKLDDAENLTNEQKAKMKSLVDSLNEALPALNLQLDEETGHLKNQRGEVDQLVESYKKQAQAQAAQERLVKLYEDQYEAENNLKKAEAERANARQKYDQLLWKSYQLESAMRKEANSEDGSVERYNQLAEELAGVNEEIRLAKNGMGDLDIAFVTSSGTVNEVNGAIEDMTNIMAEGANEPDILAENTKKATAVMDAAWTVQGRTMKTLMSDLKDYVMVVGGETYNVSQETYDDIQEISSAYRELLADQEENINRSLDLFGEFNGGAETSAKDLIDNLNANSKGLEDWADNIQALANKGIDQGLLKELEEAGPASATKVKAMTQMSDTELKNYSDKWREVKDRIHEVALDQTEDAKKQAEESIGKMIGVAEDNKDGAAAAYEDLGRYMIDGAGGAIKDGTSNYVIPVTQQMVEGMVKQYDDSLAEANVEGHGENVPKALGEGIRNHEDWALRAIDDLVHDMEQRYINDTEEHSPPKLFKDHAALIPVAMAEGIKDGEGKVVGAMDELVDAAEKAFKIEPDNNRFKAPDKGFVIDPNTYKFKTPDKNKMIIDPENRRFRFEPYDGDNKKNEFLPSSGKTEDSFSGGDSLSPRSKNNNNKSRSSRRGGSGYYSGYSIERPLTINLVLRNGEAFARFVAPYLDLINAESVTLQQGGAAW